MKKVVVFLLFQLYSLSLLAQINTDRVQAIGRNALYFEDYVLSIQYFNQVIKAKPWLAEPYFYRAVAKVNLDDYKGAEEDCTLCLERNPFFVQAYYCRGIARHNQEKYAEAIADYDKGLEFKPEDQQMLVNKAVANIQQKDYEAAEKDFERIMFLHPRYTRAYLSRGAMYLEKGDTAKALADYNKSIELDPYFPPAYGNRALVYYQQHNMQDALADLNEAIRLDPRQDGYYINRGLVRYQLNDLRGAMADYDQVISMDKHNLIARFNRGLLRAQVGDNNQAIADFDVVLQLEPDNYMAYYNRALLRTETGDYRGAVRDYDVVLEQYPRFIPGYYSRAEAKKKMRDTQGAEKDYWTAFEIEQKTKKSGNAATVASAGTQQKPDPDKHPDAGKEEEKENTREQSDKNIDKFNRLVVFDKEDERKSKYSSEIRGRVQDRNVRVDLEPQFIISYYEKIDPVKELVYYNKVVDDYNNRMVLNRKLRLTNQEAPLTEDQVALHFASINEYSAKLEQNDRNADAYFGRGMDFMLVQDFTEALEDFSRAIELNPSFVIAYFNRAVVRYKQLEYVLATQTAESTMLNDVPAMSLDLFTGKKALPLQQNRPVQSLRKDEKKAYEHEMIMHDYDKVIRLNPDFVYAYFNRANLRCAQRDYRAAILDYNEAIEREPDFAEAYFNRGLTRLYLGDTERGIVDLSKAGELGIINAYSIIKRMTSD